MTTSFLESYLEKAASLPIDVNRCLRLIRELDEQFQLKSMQLEDLQQEYLNRLKNKDRKQEMQKPELQAMLEEIRQLQEECLGYCRSKVEISTQSYEVVGEKIEVLEKELKIREEEYKQQIKPITIPKPKMIVEKFNISNDPLEIKDTPLDQSEPRYCYCNGFSYGEMIKCDNPFCEKEWFHFACINITSQPKGKWYCKECKKHSLKF